MFNEKVEKIKLYLTLLLSIVFIWMTITSTICRCKHPELTETQLFLRIHKSFVLNFD